MAGIREPLLERERDEWKAKCAELEKKLDDMTNRRNLLKAQIERTFPRQMHEQHREIERLANLVYRMRGVVQASSDKCDVMRGQNGRSRNEITEAAAAWFKAIEAYREGEPMGEFATPPNRFACVECGPVVKADEDGCCVHCGRDCTIYEDGKRVPGAAERVAELEVEVAFLRPFKDAIERLRDPITGDAYFMVIDHPDGYPVATFGGPYDSFTMSKEDDDGNYYFERYDHDAGLWIEGELKVND